MGQVVIYVPPQATVVRLSPVSPREVCCKVLQSTNKEKGLMQAAQQQGRELEISFLKPKKIQIQRQRDWGSIGKTKNKTMTEGFYLQGMIFPLAKNSNQNMEFVIIKVSLWVWVKGYSRMIIPSSCLFVEMQRLT